MSLLITDAGYTNTLAAVRSLGRKNLKITVAGESRFAITFFSKYCFGKRIYTSPLQNLTKFIENIIEIVKNDKFDVLFPISTSTTVPISFYKDRFEKYTRVPVADYEVLIKAHDKSQNLRIAKRIGIPIPETFFPESHEEVKKISKELKYPVVIKRRKGTGVEKGVRYVRTPQELIEEYDKMEKLSCDSLIEEQRKPMIQEYVPGEIRDVCVLFDHGEPKAALAQRRIWTLPPQGGPGILNETISDPKLIELALKLMRELNWHGVAQVEFKLDATGKPKLMEVNPKFWGTLALSISAGIDFPYLLYKIAIGEKINPIFDYVKGLKFLWIYDDIHYLLRSPNKVSNMVYFIKVLTCKSAIDISLTDPKPEIFKILATSRKLIKIRNKADY